MKIKKEIRPEWTTTVFPEEYDYVEQFTRMVKLANKNKEFFCEMDVGKVWGLILTVKRLKEENAALKEKELDEYAIIKSLSRENAALRKMLSELTDCYFLHRNEGLMELMMRADRMLENDVK